MHLTDDQLNEYLDNEIKDRTQVELHLSSCEDCAARFAALQALFDDIESLPELAISKSIAAPVTRRVSRRESLPRSLRLTVTLQAAAAIIAVSIAAPFVEQFISPYLSSLDELSLTDMFLQMQTQWMTWVNMLSQFQVPSLPEIPVIELSSLSVMLTVIGTSLLWLVGNRLLLRNQMK
jgi:predicted anti-sigma-YlaC factor YlaD